MYSTLKMYSILKYSIIGSYWIVSDGICPYRAISIPNKPNVGALWEK